MDAGFRCENLGATTPHRRRREAVTVLALLWIAASPAQAAVSLPTVFSDHMVLQCDAPVPVWGTADAGETVTVKFRDQVKTTTADASGKWSVKLAPLKAGGPDTLTVNERTFTDVLVGEVWVGSGQSNMAMTAGKYTRGDSELARLVAECHPQVRFSRKGDPWWVSGTNGAGNTSCSALLFAFGVKLHKELNVPVGLMFGAVNGTPSGFWLTDEMLKDDPAAQAVIAAGQTGADDAKRKKYEADLAEWEKAAAAAREANLPEPRKPTPLRRVGDCHGEIGNLFKIHIQPMVGYGIRGVLWDQGESGTAIEGLDQFTTMGALIRGWRKTWGVGEFPWIYIQKPSGGGCAFDTNNIVTCRAEAFTQLPAEVPSDGGYVEHHIRIMQHPNTGMAISSDLGAGLHPSCKSGYGYRAATVTLGMVYGRNVEYYGPMYAGQTIADGKVRVKFTHVGQGLIRQHGDRLQGFAIAAEDRKFFWADAEIEGDTVVLSSAKVLKPVAVRYAWAGNRTWANLFNKDGLPALPFRTDAW